MNFITVHLDGDTVSLSSPISLVQGDYCMHAIVGDDTFSQVITDLAPQGMLPYTATFTFNNGTYKVRVPLEVDGEYLLLPNELLYVSGKLSASVTVTYSPGGEPQRNPDYDYPTRTFVASKSGSVRILANAGWELEVLPEGYTPEDSNNTPVE